MLNEWYKKLWEATTGRPWTFVYRDLWHRYEYFVQLQWVITGCIIGIFFGWKGLGVFWGIYSLGYVMGHISWGTKYIPNQGGE